MTDHVLYRFFDGDNRLLYVGLTSNPVKRLAQHRSGKPWWTQVARVEFEHFPDRATVETAERDAIRAEHPLHNIVHAAGASPGLSCVRMASPELPKCLQLNGVYALGLSNGECRVGLVLRGDEGGVVITEYRWLIGMFDFPDRWISADAIVTWIQAEKMPHQAGWNKEDTVYDMDPLADFQTKWHEKGKVEHGRV